MKILIVEDDDSKRCEIIQVLCNTGIVTKKNFTESKSIISAKENLREEQFDILLLDINLPQRDGDKAIVVKGGLTLFKEFKFDMRFNQPKEIIAITAYEEELKEVKKEFENCLLHVIHYHTIKEEWKNKLIERLEYLYSSTRTNIEYKYDLVIICALIEPELTAIKKITSTLTRVHIDNTNIPFYKTTLEFEDKSLSVIIVSINKMGMVPTSVLATQAIEIFRPKYIAMTGIAAGIEGEVKLGDILVANPCWDSGSGKIKKDAMGKQLFEIDPRQETINPDINYNILELSGDKSFLNKVREEWSGDLIENVLRVHSGPLASGAAVIANGDVSEEIRKQQNRNLIGIEMEAYGLIYAAKYATEPKPEPLVIKSVCDFADENKTDGFQKYAAYTSASFLYEYARRYIKPHK